MHWSRNTIKYKYFSQVSLHLGSEAVSANSFKLNAGGAEYTRFVSGRTKMEPCGSSARAHFPHAPKTTQRRDHNNSTNPVRRPNSATPRPPRCSRTEPRTSPSRSRWCPSRGRCLPDRRTERRPPGGTRSAGRRADGSRYNWVRRRLLLLSRPCAFACVCVCVREIHGFYGCCGVCRRDEAEWGKRGREFFLTGDLLGSDALEKMTGNYEIAAVWNMREQESHFNLLSSAVGCQAIILSPVTLLLSPIIVK